MTFLALIAHSSINFSIDSEGFLADTSIVYHRREWHKKLRKKMLFHFLPDSQNVQHEQEKNERFAHCCSQHFSPPT